MTLCSNRTRWSILSAGVLVILLTSWTAVRAAATYEDLSGRFVIDLPDAG